MLTVTQEALNALKEHLCQHKMDAAIRITMMRGGCVEENLRFILCEMQPNDLCFSFDGLSFLLDRELAARCGRITIDFAAEYDRCPCSGRNGGFIISSECFSFRCCGHSFQADGAGCWEVCPADCSERSADAYDREKESLLHL